MHSWTVRTGPDRDRLGTVREVLLDEQGEARYLEVDLADDDRTILVPAGYAQGDPDDEEIWIPNLGREDYQNIPSMERDELRTEDEDRLARAWEGTHSEGRYYESPHFRTRGPGAERRHDEGGTARTGRAEEVHTTRTDRSHETEATRHTTREGEARTRTPGERDETTRTHRSPEGEAPARVDTLDDIEVADHDPDPRGWTVVGRDGETVGRVDHLLGDTRTMKVRYFVVALDREVVEGKDQMLIPAGHASLDEDRDRVVVRALDRDRIGGAPGWTGGDLDREHERKVVGWFDEGYRGENRYHHPRYRSDRLQRR